MWGQHLHWPKEGVPKKRASRDPMPFAITSEKWVEYHKEQERKKSEKENDIKRRKMKRESKKSTTNKTKLSKKKTKNKEAVSKTGPADQENSGKSQGRSK